MFFFKFSNISFTDEHEESVSISEAFPSVALSIADKIVKWPKESHSSKFSELIDISILSLDTFNDLEIRLRNKNKSKI